MVHVRSSLGVTLADDRLIFFAPGCKIIELSSLTRSDDIVKVLAHPDLIAKGDAAGIFRLTGVLTNKKRLEELTSRCVKRVLCQKLLDSHGCKTLEMRLRQNDGGLAPTAIEKARTIMPEVLFATNIVPT